MTRARSAGGGGAPARPRALAAVIAALVLAPAAAHADGAAAPPTEEARLSASLLSGEGDRLYDVADFAGAAEKYKAAYLLFPEPELLFNLGECFWQLRDPDKAAFFYRRFLAKKPDAVNRPIVEARLTELERLPRPAPPAPAPDLGAGSGPPAPPAKRALITAPDESAIGFTSDAPAPPSPHSDSIFKKWYFWVGIGVVAAAVGVTAIVVAATH